MRRYIPTMYCKNIFTIPYDKLNNQGLTCLIFDLDNTLALIDQKKCTTQVIELFQELKKRFKLYIISNNSKKRIQPYLDELGIQGVAWAMKPLTRGLKHLQKKYDLSREQMVMIGDQLMTDIVSGNRFGIKTILVDPLGERDLKVTNINRYFERKKIEQLSKQGILKRGNYYE